MQVICAIAAYVLTSSTLVYSNKYLMHPEMSIPAPLFVTWYQCIVTLLMMYVLAHIRSSYEKGGTELPLSADDGSGAKKRKTSVVIEQLPSKFYSYDMEKGKKSVMMSIVFVAMISMTNVCIKYVEVSFYQVARGLTPVVSSALSFLVLGETTSLPTVLTLCVILLGYALGVKGEVRFSLFGTIFGFGSSLLCVMYPILTKKKMSRIFKDDKWAVIYYNNAHAAILFIPLIIMFDLPILIEHSEKLFMSTFWFWMTIAAFLGSFVGVAAVTQLKLTSPLTHNVIGNGKGAAQSILGAYLWSTPLTHKGVLGLATVLVGSMMYARSRIVENQSRKGATEKSTSPRARGGEMTSSRQKR